MIEKLKNIKFDRNDNELKKYVEACDGKKYQYNLQVRGIYYCPNNIIINDRNEIVKLPSHQILADYFIIDTKEGTVSLYDKELRDGFIKTVADIENIKIENNLIKIYKKDNRIKNPKNRCVTIKLNQGKILSFEDNSITKCGDQYLAWCNSIKELRMSNLRNCGSFFLNHNETLENLYLPEMSECGIRFLYSNTALKALRLPKVKKCGFQFMDSNNALREFYAPELEDVGAYFMQANTCLNKFYAPKIKSVAHDFMLKHRGNIKEKLAQCVVLTSYSNEDLYCSTQNNERENQWWNK